MATDRAPSFQFYPKDARDFKVRRMSLAARGAYWSIMWDMWIDSKDQCSILDCNPFIANALGVSEEEWMKLRKEIQHEIEPLFLEKDGRLYSHRLSEEVKKQRKYSKSQSERASKRWDTVGMPRHSHGIATAMPNACSSSSSSSSLSESEKTPHNPSSADADSTRSIEDWFEDWWKAMPARDGKRLYKAKALEFYRRYIPHSLRVVALAAAKAYAKHCKDTDRMPVDPHRFLAGQKGQLWQDFMPTIPPPASAQSPPAAVKAEFIPPPPEALAALQRLGIAIPGSHKPKPNGKMDTGFTKLIPEIERQASGGHDLTKDDPRPDPLLSE